MSFYIRRDKLARGFFLCKEEVDRLFSLLKAKVIREPGKRGGKFYYDKHGKIVYGERPAEARPAQKLEPGSPPIKNQIARPMLRVGKKPKRYQAGGLSATGQTNTTVGDIGEMNLVPHIERFLGTPNFFWSRTEVNNYPIDLVTETMAVEVKTITTAAKNQRAVMSPDEVMKKKAFAKRHGLRAIMLLLSFDHATKKMDVYAGEGFKSYQLSSKSLQKLGTISAKQTNIREAIETEKKRIAGLPHAPSRGIARRHGFQVRTMR